MSEDRLSRLEWALRLADTTALRGTCCRRQVGCVLLDARGRVLATGYNGPPAGYRHCTKAQPCGGEGFKSGEGLDHCNAIHAEQNALMQCRDVDAIDVVALTTSPCTPCMRMLMNTGVRIIAFRSEYVGTPERLIKEWLGNGPFGDEPGARRWFCMPVHGKSWAMARNAAPTHYEEA